MLDVLARYGVPSSLLLIIKRLHTDVMVKLTVGDKVDIEFPSTVGVKQGDTLAPILFLFVVDFNFWASLYADDSALLFASRSDLERGARLLKSHLARFGLVMHCGVADAAGNVVSKSKTEAVFFPPPNYTSTNDDTLPLRVDDGTGVVTFTQHFRYLGVILSSTLTDEEEIGRRLASAAAAFGCLRKSLFNRGLGCRSLRLKDKGKVYSSLVLGILLYGCESWVLTQELRQRLNVFHNRCVRAMCNTSRYDPVSGPCAPLAKLAATLNLTPLDQHISQRKLRWAGHVMRMKLAVRLPRKFMTSWVAVKRPQGRGAHSYGHALTKELRNLGFNLDRGAIQIGVSEDWAVVAQDRVTWRALVMKRQLSIPISDQASVVQALPAPSTSSSSPSSTDGGDSTGSSTAAPPVTTWAQRLRPRR